jgi:formate dehydrogenase accessory protein FdhD
MRAIFRTVWRVGDTLRIEVARSTPLMEEMQRLQTVFNTTGGTHAAALFASDAVLLASAEDLGRHNALTKVIGQCLLRNRPTARCCTWFPLPCSLAFELGTSVTTHSRTGKPQKKAAQGGFL